MTAHDPVRRGRRAFARRAWEEAYQQLAAAKREHPLGAADLERLATAAYLTGRDTESSACWEQAQRGFLETGDVPATVRCAFWLAFGLLHRGEAARAGGWLARAGRLLQTTGADCVERGYLLFPNGFLRFMEADFEGAHDVFREAADIGARFGDADLIGLARHGQGRALLRLGDVAGGLALLDEVMVAITAGETTPMIAGDVYCSVIEACQEVFDVHRAQEWTEALSAWCDEQPDLVPYRGQCLVHRSQLSQFQGDWPQAWEEVRRAHDRLSDPPGQPALGMAWYQRGELQRLRGDFDAAEQAYRRASEHGRVPQPGLALLRLADGAVDAAVAMIRHAVHEAGGDRSARAQLLSAYVEIMLAGGDVETARRAADELAVLAEEIKAPLLEASVEQARGAVLLAEGDASRALAALRRAWTRWWELKAPYEVARVRVLIGAACRDLGDADGALMEWDSARQVFRELGAVPDLGHLEALVDPDPTKRPGGLSDREVEVLALVAAGMTNRQIAAELVISEHTVRRHLQNIFTKLDLPSRAAATAFAYEHDLV